MGSRGGVVGYGIGELLSRGRQKCSEERKSYHVGYTNERIGFGRIGDVKIGMSTRSVWLPQGYMKEGKDQKEGESDSGICHPFRSVR